MAAEELAEALRSLAESLRFYQAMGLKDLALTRDYFPTPEEALTRQEPFLLAQLGAIQPKVILALGAFAAQTLLRTKEPIGKLRGRVFPLHSMVLIPTFHPAFLLRNPGQA